LVLVEEALFVGGLVVWSLLRAHVFDPSIAHTEQFMDMALLTASGRSASYPPYDPWMSGHTVNYYYFGYLMFATLTKLSRVQPAVGYNLSLSFLFASVVAGAYSLGYALTRRFLWSALAPLFVALLGNWHAILWQIPHGGCPGSASVSSWGALFDSTRVVGGHYTLADWACRQGGGGYTTINEFPLFSLILGDLHPHLMALPIVLLVLAFGCNIIFAPAGRSCPRAAWNLDSIGRLAVLAVAAGSLFAINSWDYPTYLLVLAACVGVVAYVTDASPSWWKTPLETLVALGAASLALFAPFYLHFQSLSHGLGLVTTPSDPFEFIQVMGFPLLATLFLVGALAALLRPAEEEAEGMAQEYAAGHSPLTPVPSGHPQGDAPTEGEGSSPVIYQHISPPSPPEGVLDKEGDEGGKASGPEPGPVPTGSREAGSSTISASLLVMCAAIVVLGGLLHQWVALLLLLFGAWTLQILWRVLNTDEPNRMDAAALVCVAVGLFVLVLTEVVYIRDAFDGGASYRMNTVFKFYYQAWVLLGLGGAYGAYRAWHVLRGYFPPAYSLGAAAILALGALGAAVQTANIPNYVVYASGVQSLDGSAWLQRMAPGDYAAIQWLRGHPSGGSGSPSGGSGSASGNPVVLEAEGPEYLVSGPFGRISTFSGLPTVMGWAGHEDQWRPGNADIGVRVDDVHTIYSTPDVATARRLLRTYDVRFVVVGSMERQAYGSSPSGLAKFSRFMTPVFRSAGTTIYTW
ncbi:MAG: hypothetical protein JOZ41_10820, partial [Chloroflexi bacterium]|nr:hypothetical protein [Chloroflexota bacterium]